MPDGHLFDMEEYPEVPIFRPPARRKSEGDARFTGEYPPEWDTCQTCDGTGYAGFDRSVFEFAVGVAQDDPGLVKVVLTHKPSGAWTHGEGRSELAAKSDIKIAAFLREHAPCSDCLRMGSLKARVRLEAGHRCIRCLHPYMPRADAKMLGVHPSGYYLCPASVPPEGMLPPDTEPPAPRLTWLEGWSPCDDRCHHGGPMRAWTTEGWSDFDPTPEACGAAVATVGKAEAAWRVLTVHHADGNKSNCRWWNLLALCQRCHLEIQAKVVMERVYPHEHSAWFKPYVAGYYAWVYLGEELTREETEARLEELLDLERAPA